jgi:hypothetical protein
MNEKRNEAKRNKQNGNEIEAKGDGKRTIAKRVDSPLPGRSTVPVYSVQHRVHILL